MGLDIFFAENVRNALLAANEANKAPLDVIKRGIECAEYHQGIVVALAETYETGYRAALITLALAFGLSPEIIVATGPWRNPAIPRRGITLYDADGLVISKDG